MADVQDAGEAQREREAKAQARLLQSAAPIAAADPAGRYLSGSGLSLDQARGAGLRFHPGAPVTVDGETLKLPALLAPVRTPGGERAAAVHCFHLTPEGGLARIERQTHTRGEPGDGGVWLLNPAGAERAVLCTGIEDALAAVRILPPERQAAVAVAATLTPERTGSIELPPNAREVILVPDDLTGETAWAALKRRCEEKDTAFSVSRWLPDGYSVYDVLLLDGPEALTQTLGAALSSPLLHKTCERLHHDWRRHIETAQGAGVLLTQTPGYEGLTARLQSMTDALSGHHGPAPEALVLALHQLVRRPLDAALSPHTEALCQRYLGGAARDGRWPFRIVRGKERFPASVALLSPERGTWTNETTGGQGDLLDLIRIEGKHENSSATMAAARAFLEAEHEARRQLNAQLAPHTEALCESYLPDGVKLQDGQWRTEDLTVRLSGPLQGTWRNDMTGRQGDLLDLIHIEGKHDNDMTGTMAPAHTFLHGEAQAALRHDWKAHDERALAAGNPLYHTPEYHQLIGRTQDLVQAYATLRDPHSFFKPQHLEQRIAAHQAHLEASAPLRRHAGAARAHEQRRCEQLGRGGAPPVFSDQYPQWRRSA